MQAEALDNYSPNRTRLLNILTVITAITLAVAIFSALFLAETDAQQGNVQRIFYMHVGAFSGGATAFFITVIAGVAYLRTRNPKWDRLAVASVEMGLPLMTITLITGIVWSRPTWNTWWAGDDPRVNSMAVMWLLYAAYLTLRAAVDNPERRMRFAAVYGILAFISVLYVFFVIRFNSQTLHPVVLGPSPIESNAKGSFGVKDPRMIFTISLSSIGWMLLAFTLIWHRLRMENMAERIRMLKLRVLSQ
jgi:heme exporter protein C